MASVPRWLELCHYIVRKVVVLFLRPWIAQYFIRLVDALEVICRFCVVLVANFIGMTPLGKLEEAGLDFTDCGRLRQR